MVRPAAHVRQLVVEACGGHHAALRPGEQGVDAGRVLPQCQGRQVACYNRAQSAHTHLSRGQGALQSAPHAPTRVSHEAAKVSARQPDMHN